MRPPRRLSSARNPVLKEARALQAKKVRSRRGLFLAEGEDIVAVALARGVQPRALLYEQERFEQDGPSLDSAPEVDDCYVVPRELLATATTLAAPPRVMAIMEQPAPISFSDRALADDTGLLLAGVADPGNVGTIIRSAAALGADWVALGPRSSDPFHPRAVRAAMGATFSLPLLLGVSPEDLATRDGLRIVAAAPGGGRPPWEVDLAAPHVLMLGAEREGLEPALEALGDHFPVERVSIPQVAGSESLNVSAAAAALLVEARRQRAAAG